MAFSYNKSNLATSTLTAGINTSATSITVSDATGFPDAPFYLTLMPSDAISSITNSEIVLCTAKNSATFTITRGQRGTTARSFNTGAIVSQGIYTQDLDYAQSVRKKVFSASLASGSTNTLQITDDMLPDTPSDGLAFSIYVTEDVNSTPVYIKLNNGSSVIALVHGITTANSDYLSAVTVKGGVVYDVVFYDNKWIIPNMFGRVRAGEVDYGSYLVEELPEPGVEGREYILSNVYKKITEFDGYTSQDTYSGKNLLNDFVSPTGDNLSTAGITYTIANDGTITTSGTSSLGFRNVFWRIRLPAGTYKFSGCPDGGSVSGYSFCIEVEGHSGFYYDTGEGGTFTLSQETVLNAYAVRLGSDTGINMDGKVFKPMITVATASQDFEPYVGGTASPNPEYPQVVKTVTGLQTINIGTTEYELNLGKNLFNPSSASLSTTASFSGTAGNAFTTSANTYRDFIIIPVKPNTTYSISTSGSSYSAYTQYYIGGLSSLTTESGQVWGWITGSGTITTGINTRFIGVIIRPRTSAGDISPQTLQLLNDIQFQLEEGLSATSYSSYFTPIELCRIGTYKDYIYKSGSDWYIHKEIEKWEIKSVDNNWYYEAAGGYNRFYRTRAGVASPSSRTSNGLLVDRFIPDTTDGYYHSFYVNGYIMFYAWQGGPASLADFGTWVNSNLIVVYYPLATATDTKITDATLISQLDAIGNVKMNATIIPGCSGDLPCALIVENTDDSYIAKYICINGQLIPNGIGINAVATENVKDGAVTQSKLDQTLLRELAYLPGDALNLDITQGFARGANSKTKFNCVLPLCKSLEFVTGGTITYGSWSFQVYDFQNATSKWVNGNDGGTASFVAREDGIHFQCTTDTELGTGNYDFAMFTIAASTITFTGSNSRSIPGGGEEEQTEEEPIEEPQEK